MSDKITRCSICNYEFGHLIPIPQIGITLCFECNKKFKEYYQNNIDKMTKRECIINFLGMTAALSFCIGTMPLNYSEEQKKIIFSNLIRFFKLMIKELDPNITEEFITTITEQVNRLNLQEIFRTSYKAFISGIDQ